MASHRTAAKAATVNLSERYHDVKPQAVSFKWWQRWNEARRDEVPTAHSQVLKKYDCGSLTPPTSSKWPSPLAMSCPLKAQEKETSRTGSLVTWQGNTMLSPTIISISVGPWVILVGSARDRKKKEKKVKRSHFLCGWLPVSHNIYYDRMSSALLIFQNKSTIWWHIAATSKNNCN